MCCLMSHSQSGSEWDAARSTGSSDGRTRAMRVPFCCAAVGIHSKASGGAEGGVSCGGRACNKHTII